LKAEDFNELPRPERRTALRIILEVLRVGDLTEGLILLLFAAYFAAEKPVCRKCQRNRR
jgi:hypothetical protein